MGFKAFSILAFSWFKSTEFECSNHLQSVYLRNYFKPHFLKLAILLTFILFLLDNICKGPFSKVWKKKKSYQIKIKQWEKTVHTEQSSLLGKYSEEKL